MIPAMTYPAVALVTGVALALAVAGGVVPGGVVPSDDLATVLPPTVMGKPPAAPMLPDATPFRIPFAVGERATYRAKINFLNAGSATTRVVGVETIRGVQTYHTSLDIRGRVLGKRVDNRYESWFDPRTFSSLRHVQHTDEGGGAAGRVYEFHPERRIYVRNGEERPGVEAPLDEGSFLFFLRSIPLEVGRTYTFNRYYRADRNPVTVRVVRRERVKVPAGEFMALVVQPVIRSRGLFGEEARAEVWLSDDPQRRLLKLKSKLSVGTLYLELE
jgi:hypothetical protein